MQPVRAKYFVNRPITFCDWNGANVPPKSAQNTPKGLTHTRNTARSLNGAHRAKKPENDTEIYSLTVCRSVTLWRQIGA